MHYWGRVINFTIQIYTSELSYVANLQLLSNFYVVPMQVESMVRKSFLEKDAQVVSYEDGEGQLHYTYFSSVYPQKSKSKIHSKAYMV